MITWVAPEIVVSSNGLSTAIFTASLALSSPLPLTNTDMCNTLVLHNGLDIGKIKVNDSRYIDQVCDSLYRLL